MKNDRFIQRTDGLWEVDLHHHIHAGVMARDASNIHYSGESNQYRMEEMARLSELTGVHPKNIIMMQQVHGDDIVLVDRDPGEAKPWHYTADAMVTTIPGICLVIRTADCVPVIIYEPEAGMLGAAHSGWRGTKADICGKMVDLMVQHGGCIPGNMRAVILPSIGPGSYQVGPEFENIFPAYVKKRGGSLYLDLWQIIEDSLLEHGILGANIIRTQRCTLEESPLFFSHRNGDSGRNLNFAFIKNTLPGFLGMENSSL